MRTNNREKPTGNTGTEAADSGDNSTTRLGRRSFLKRLGWGGTAIVPGVSLLASGGVALADSGGRLTRGDVAIFAVIVLDRRQLFIPRA